MLRIQMLVWIAISLIVIVGFFVIMYLLCFYPLVVGNEQEWKFIEMMFGALVTVFGQLLHSWMTWFVGSPDRPSPREEARPVAQRQS